ncbi:MAG: SAM-dependent chlorinase/fluorinase, partial [Candidatus Lokiarchaeota archaeon]|nr:SAM-dependent chlorinase/fluorinase [Candidatus Lokiarchaeota archaeon]
MAQHVGLLTDFGTKAGYVASMKGAILSTCASCTIVDLSHEIAPHNVMEAALFLENCCGYFPRGFIFLAVVDPGVGTGRGLLCLRTRKGGQVFVAPDNGLLHPVMEARGVDLLVSLENRKYWRDVPSRTFHGRDIMAPVAAHVAAGVEVSDLGPARDPASAVRLEMPPPARVDGGDAASGAVLYSDQFGNVVTNLGREHLEALGVHEGEVLGLAFQGDGGATTCTIAAPLEHTYAGVGRGELLCLLNSEGRFEVA